MTNWENIWYIYKAKDWSSYKEIPGINNNDPKRKIGKCYELLALGKWNINSKIKNMLNQTHNKAKYK